MWRSFYNLLLILAAPAIVLVLLAKPRCRRGLAQRLGIDSGGSEANQPNRPGGPDKPVVWIHAVSLGEVVAAVPLVKALHERHPEYRYLVTTVTEAGREAVEQRLAGVAEHRYAPLDFPWAVAGMVARWRPVLYLCIETELWPNLLWTLKRRGIPAVLVNGRLSSRSYARQDLPVVRDFYRSVLDSLALCLMQSRRDAERIQALGARHGSVHVTGNIKVDQPPAVADVEAAFRAQLGVGPHDLLFLAGSTHPGEEEQLVAAYRELADRHPAMVLMLAPRHIERAEDVERMAREAGCVVQRRSRLSGPGTGPRVIVLDTRGELARAYREAVVAYVGGTLIPVGGHNLLEPAAWGKPVLFGPHTDHCAEIAAMLEEAGGARRVTGADRIVAQVDTWLRHPAEREAAGQAARGVVTGNQGALGRSLQLIEPYLRSSSGCTDSIQTVTDPAVARR